MSSTRPTFAKRNREASLKDKARLKEQRRAAKRAEVRVSKGPEIAWDEAVRPIDDAIDPVDETTPPAPEPAPDPEPSRRR
jgi:hypothetical protein